MTLVNNLTIDSICDPVQENRAEVTLIILVVWWCGLATTNNSISQQKTALQDSEEARLANANINAKQQLFGTRFAGCSYNPLQITPAMSPPISLTNISLTCDMSGHNDPFVSSS